MANAKKSAKDSLVMINVASTPTAFWGVKSYSLEINGNVIDVSDMAASFKEFLPGQYEWKVKAELFWDPESGDAQTTFEAAILAGTELTVTIRPEGTGSGKAEYDGKGYATSWSIGGAVGEAVTGTVEIQGSGALSPTAQSAG